MTVDFPPAEDQAFTIITETDTLRGVVFGFSALVVLLYAIYHVLNMPKPLSYLGVLFVPLVIYMLYEAFSTLKVRHFTFLSHGLKIEGVNMFGGGVSSTHTHPYSDLSHFSMTINRHKSSVTCAVYMHTSDGAKRLLHKSGDLTKCETLLAHLSGGLSHYRTQIDAPPSHYEGARVHIMGTPEGVTEVHITPFSLPRRVAFIATLVIPLAALGAAYYVFVHDMLPKPETLVSALPAAFIVMIALSFILIPLLFVPAFQALSSCTLTIKGSEVTAYTTFLGLWRQHVASGPRCEFEVQRGTHIELMLPNMSKRHLASRMTKQDLDLLDACLRPEKPDAYSRPEKEELPPPLLEVVESDSDW